MVTPGTTPGLKDRHLRAGLISNMLRRMADKKFKTGDQVQLKSGGPTMTVEVYSGMTEKVHCRWFDPVKHDLKEADFEEDMLEQVTQKGAPPYSPIMKG
jgi:uncharacterized protein YodC (DUF2158 family)